MIKTGDRVRMTEEFKAKMRGDCKPGQHVGATSDLGGEACIHCSLEHVEEFGECEGVVEDLLDYNNVQPDDPAYDPNKVGPEFNVRWAPSNLRYGYHPNNLRLA